MGQKSTELRANWSILLACFVGIMLGWALPVFVLGPMTPPLLREFGWSPAGLVASASLFSLGAAMGSPIAGWLADRFDARTIAASALSLLAACFAALGAIDGWLWQLHALYLLMGLVGAGTGGIVYTRVIGGRFVAARGIAIGIALSGTGVTSLFIPIFVAEVTAASSWRAVGPGIAVLIFVFAIPIVLVGLRTATRKSLSAAATADSSPGGAGATRKEAIRDIRFYLLGLSICIFGFFSNILVINVVPALLEAGASSARAAELASMLGLAIIAGRLGVGWLLDHAPAVYVSAAVFALGAAGAFLFTLGDPGLVIFGVLSIGLLLGAEIDMMSYMTLRYFGVRSFGEIYGLLMGVYTMVTIGGPLLAAVLLATGGGYAAAYGAAAASFVVATLVLLVLSRVPNGK